MPEPIAVTISAGLISDLYYNPDGTTFDGWTRVASVEDDESRWSRNYTLVLKDPDDLFWGVLYSVGKTEEQENDMPWGRVDDAYQIDLIRLYPRTVTTTVYDPRPAEVSG